MDSHCHVSTESLKGKVPKSIESKLRFKNKIPILQNASFYDTNRGEGPNLTACNQKYILRAVNHNYGFENKKK